MKLEFKHFAYIALAIVALYLAYKHLVKGPEIIGLGTNGNTTSGRITSGTSTGRITGGTSTGRITGGTSTGRITGGTSTGRITTGGTVVRPPVVHEEVSEDDAFSFDSGRITGGTATTRNSNITGSGVTRR